MHVAARRYLVRLLPYARYLRTAHENLTIAADGPAVTCDSPMYFYFSPHAHKLVPFHLLVRDSICSRGTPDFSIFFARTPCFFSSYIPTWAPWVSPLPYHLSRKRKRKNPLLLLLLSALLGHQKMTPRRPHPLRNTQHQEQPQRPVLAPRRHQASRARVQGTSLRLLS